MLWAIGLVASAPASVGPVANEREVSLLVLYTQDAIDEAGGEHQIHADIRGAIARLNESFLASGIDGSVRLAGAYATDYDESDVYQAMLDDLRRGWQSPETGGVQPADPALIDLRCMRDLLGADLISLMVSRASNGGEDGIADQLHTLGGVPSLVFSVVRRSAAIELEELTHQIGHNLGAHHENALSLLPSAHAHAFSTPNFGMKHTVMWSMRERDALLAQFSNPDVEFDGEPTGIALGADNAGVIRGAIGAVSSYRTDQPAIRSMWSATRDDAFGASIASDRRNLAIGRPEFFDDNYGLVDLFTMHGEEDGGECGIAPTDPFNPDDADAWTGQWLDASGDRVLAGGTGAAGIAYVLARDPEAEWRTEGMLFDRNNGSRNFAFNGAIDGTTAIIQEAAMQLHPGRLHFHDFDGDQWQLTQSLILPGLFERPASSEVSLDIRGNLAAVGVQVEGQIAGVIMLARDGAGVWNPAQDIPCMTCEGLPGFSDLALSESRLAVSHRLGVDLYIKSPTGRYGSRWAPEQTLSDPRIRVGGPVAIGRDVIVMGDPGAGGELRGSVFIWAWDTDSETWVLEDLILGEAGERLGRSVALNGPWIFASTHPDGVRAFYRSTASIPAPNCTLAASIPAGDIEAAPGEIVVIEAEVIDNRGERFAWYLDGVRLQDDGTYSGSSTPTLTVESASDETAGLYEFEAIEVACSASAGASLSIRCPADLDGDGDADADDLFVFLDAIAAGDLDICDLDGDADCDAEDFFLFADLLASGC